MLRSFAGPFTLALMSALALLVCDCSGKSGRTLYVVRGDDGTRDTQTSVTDSHVRTAGSNAPGTLGSGGAKGGSGDASSAEDDEDGRERGGRNNGDRTDTAGAGGATAHDSGGTANPDGGATRDQPASGGTSEAVNIEPSAGTAGEAPRGTGGEAGGSASGMADPIHVAADAELEGADGSESHPFPSLRDAVAAIVATEGSDAPWDGRIIVHPGRYEMLETVELPPSADIEFQAGVTMAMGADVNLHANRSVKVLGTEGERVVFTWLVEEEPWGCFTLFVPDSHDNEFYWATFEHGGQATYKEISVRGALSLEGASGHISHCTFQDNAGDDGLSLGAAGALVDYCTFVNNSGDGLDADGASGAEVAHCYFDGNGNDALDTGEGADLWAHDNVMLNSADTGVEIGEASIVTIDHNIVVGNHIGIGIRDDSDPVVSYNTLYANEFGIAGYHFKDGWGYGKGSVSNTIVSGSTIADVALLPEATTVISYSCIQSGMYVVSVDDEAAEGDILPLEGEGLLSQGAGCDDPLFVNPDELDFHLMSTTGHWDAAGQAWVTDDETSPCVDAGDPDMSVGDEPAPNGGRVNMGAYGATAEASHSP